MNLYNIKKPILKHLVTYQKILTNAIKSDVPLLNNILNYLEEEKGKQIRPMFVIFSAGLCGNINITTYRAAAMIELLHTASLLHDDVVDNAEERRGKKTINNIWQNKIAILVGDFLVSKGILLGIENKDFNIISLLVKAGYEMSEGELLQIEKSISLNITENDYFNIITKKTGILIASCCSCGAVSVNAPENKINAMYEFGKYAGIAFQIRDDILDLEKKINSGKHHGNDIKEKKLTLPLIYMLSNTSEKHRQKIINSIKNHKQNPEKINEIIDMVKNSTGIDYAQTKLNEYQNKAMNILEQFNDNTFKKLLQKLLIYNSSREG